ncbi:MAG: MATE family efflux transporter, partial [Paludibacteraceae bacterium]|nr:MATE family efflux transporter [Paludibacteraceae bacterium]
MTTNRDILRLAVPSILANITIPLVGIVDTAIVGHLSDAAAIGGIAIGTMLFDLLYWNFGFLRVGTSGLTAQAYGRSKHSEISCQPSDDCRKILTQSITIAFVAA